VLTHIHASSGSGWVFVGDFRRAPFVSAAKALVRRGLAIREGASRFATTATGREVAEGIAPDGAGDR